MLVLLGGLRLASRGLGPPYCGVEPSEETTSSLQPVGRPDEITYITLHYITLHYITLHYITLHYITLHIYITYIRTYIQSSTPTAENAEFQSYTKYHDWSAMRVWLISRAFTKLFSSLVLTVLSASHATTSFPKIA